MGILRFGLPIASATAQEITAGGHSLALPAAAFSRRHGAAAGDKCRVGTKEFKLFQSFIERSERERNSIKFCCQMPPLFLYVRRL